MADDYERALRDMGSACKAGDLGSIEKTVEAADQKWSRSDLPTYVNFLRHTCDEIASCSFSDTVRRHALLKRLASSAMQKADQTQLDVQLHLLVSYLPIDLKTQSLNTQWPDDRKSSAQLWISVWRKLEDSIDATWSPEDPKNAIKPYVPPANVPFKAGMDPSAIGDPKIRAEYENHNKNNERILKKNNQQRKSREFKLDYSKNIEEYLTNIYSAPPSNREELKDLLANLHDKDMASRVLAKVKK